ncbi:MAG: hypothetical protein QXD19_06510 [Candidatus Bathyarchaeia archaeon]
MPLLIFITLLPAFIELKKPRDTGPRLIMENTPVVNAYLMYHIRIGDLEKEQKFDASIIHSLAKALEALPNLDV